MKVIDLEKAIPEHVYIYKLDIVNDDEPLLWWVTGCIEDVSFDPVYNKFKCNVVRIDGPNDRILEFADFFLDDLNKVLINIDQRVVLVSQLGDKDALKLMDDFCFDQARIYLDKGLQYMKGSRTCYEERRKRNELNKQN